MARLKNPHIAHPGDGTLQVKVYSQFKTYFEGSALTLTSENNTGPFDILPGHANFITLIKPGVIRIERPDETWVEAPVDRGVMRVSSDTVTVFLDV